MEGVEPWQQCWHKMQSIRSQPCTVQYIDASLIFLKSITKKQSHNLEFHTLSCCVHPFCTQRKVDNIGAISRWVSNPLAPRLQLAYLQRQLQDQSTGTQTWYGMQRVERRVQFEIERSSGLGAPAIQVAVNRGRCHPQRKTPRRVARPEDSRSQATVLGNQQWCLHRLQNVAWVPAQQGMFRSALMWKLVLSLKRACVGVETSCRPCQYSEHSHNVGRVYILRKCLVRAMSPKKMGGGHTSENRGVETYAYIHTTYIVPNASCQRVSRSMVLSQNVKSQKDGSDHQLPYKESSRGGTIELLLHDNKLEITIPDWSWHRVAIRLMNMNIFLSKIKEYLYAVQNCVTYLCGVSREILNTWH